MANSKSCDCAVLFTSVHRHSSLTLFIILVTFVRMSHSKNLAPKARPVFPANPTDRDFPPIKNLDAFRLLRPSNDDMVRLLLHDNLDEENFQDDDDDTQHAPLVDGSVVIRSTIPQFGIMGTHGEKARMMDVNNRIFLNTNVPFSAFICGVQGSGEF